MEIPRDELLDRASFGKQVDLFWNSRVGEYLRGRAEECYTAAVQILKTVDPTDSKAVQKAQNDVWLAERFNEWMSEAILDGLKSLDLLEQETGEDSNVD